MRQPQAALKQYFGYDSFRPGQGEVADCLLAGRDVLSVMPTGAGKSICYQIPALCMNGISLVVSPLISLMKDQVESLIQAGVPAAYLNSSLNERQFGLALRNARMGKYKLIYVAPERLEIPSFLSFAREANIAMIAVDEAHCVSQWGQDFRPSYLAIPAFAKNLSKRPVMGAFTATATPEVREDIARQLELKDPFVLVSGFDRPNLFWEVQTPRSKREALFDFVSARREESGIVYCATRKNVEEVCEFLQERGFPATRYHAGLEPEERRHNQERFVYGSNEIMVATNAFGMGIDKPDVRYVVHYNMPKDLESYYQEAGRAGRDGDKAHCLLLYSPSDVRTNQFLIEKKDEDSEADEKDRAKRIEQDLLRLKQMTVYSRTTDCLRHHILRYFGEIAGECCGSCSNCLTNFREEDITVDAQKILSCVKRAGERFGASVINDVLRGTQSDRIQKWGLNLLPTYGILSQLTREEVASRIRLLVEQDYLVQSEDQYPTLSLGPKARGLLFGGEPLIAKVKVSSKAVKADVSGQEVPQELFERLQKLRLRLAQMAGVPAYVVFSNQTLREMCQRLPRDEGELLHVSGVGSQKLKRFGKDFLREIETWRQENQ